MVLLLGWCVFFGPALEAQISRPTGIAVFNATLLRQKWLGKMLVMEKPTVAPLMYNFYNVVWATPIDGNASTLDTPVQKGVPMVPIVVNGITIGVSTLDTDLENPYDPSYPGQAAFNASYPSGAYTVNLQSSSSLVAGLAMPMLASDDFPAVDPHFNNLDIGAHLETTQLFQWPEWKSQGVDQVGFLLLEGQFADDVVSAMYSGQDAVLDALAALITQGALIKRDQVFTDGTTELMVDQLNLYQDHLAVLFFLNSGSGGVNNLNQLNGSLAPKEIKDKISASIPSSAFLQSLMGVVGNLSGTMMFFPQHIDVQIHAHPKDQKLMAGDPLELVVDASGTDLIYQWQRNGERLPIPSTNRLWVARSSPGDTGTYQVVVSNMTGRVESNPAAVQVTAIRTYADYRNFYFTEPGQQDNSVSGPEANPDQDDANNWVEYAFARHPLRSDQWQALQLTSAIVGEHRAFEWVLRRFPQLTDLSLDDYQLFQSYKLLDDWSPVGEASHLDYDAEDLGAREEITVFFTTPPETTRIFLQWKVTRKDGN